jgi:predicted nuclease of restriction endonuclease-like (RecB) superfamily
MKKKVAVVKTKRHSAAAKDKPDGLTALIDEVRGLIHSARQAAVNTVNTLQVLTNFEIGRRIVEHEQKGERRAAYGAELVKKLSANLTKGFGKGYSKANLEYMRRFYLEWHSRDPRIAQTPSGELAKLPSIHGHQKKNAKPFTLSWSHYLLLLTIKDAGERSFYEIESASENWSLRELKRQKASCLYERLSLSRNKKAIRKLANEGQIIAKPGDMLKEPYVLEFLGLDERSEYSESDLETAIIDKLEHFLLELGKGFLFEARQKRFTFDEDHFFVDLVFYNRLLRCYVIIDLKLDKLSHQDLGQMQMYVNYFDRHVKQPDENPTIGLLLCKVKKNTLVELTLPSDANVHAREYQLYLPSKALLKKKLIEWTDEREHEL